jgi:hypothetical protein
MACDLTAGYTKPCADEIGGVKNLYISALSNVSSFTETAGEITAITRANGSRFWKWALEKDLSTAQAVLTRSQPNGTKFSAQTITAILNDNRKETRNQLELLAQNDLFVIVEYANSDLEAYGIYNGMTLSTATMDSGAAKGDRFGNTVVMNGAEKENPPKVASGILAGLLVPAS